MTTIQNGPTIDYRLSIDRSDRCMRRIANAVSRSVDPPFDGVTFACAAFFLLDRVSLSLFPKFAFGPGLLK